MGIQGLLYYSDSVIKVSSQYKEYITDLVLFVKKGFENVIVFFICYGNDQNMAACKAEQKQNEWN